MDLLLVLSICRVGRCVGIVGVGRAVDVKCRWGGDKFSKLERWEGGGIGGGVIEMMVNSGVWSRGRIGRAFYCIFETPKLFGINEIDDFLCEVKGM